MCYKSGYKSRIQCKEKHYLSPRHKKQVRQSIEHIVVSLDFDQGSVRVTRAFSEKGLHHVFTHSRKLSYTEFGQLL